MLVILLAEKFKIKENNVMLDHACTWLTSAEKFFKKIYVN